MEGGLVIVLPIFVWCSFHTSRRRLREVEGRGTVNVGLWLGRDDGRDCGTPAPRLESERAAPKSYQAKVGQDELAKPWTRESDL